MLLQMTDDALTVDNDSRMFLCARFLLFIIALAAVAVAFHEIAESVLIMIVRPMRTYVSFWWFDVGDIAPGFTYGSEKGYLIQSVGGYVWGLIAGLALMTIVIFAGHWFRHEVYREVLRFHILALGVWEISEALDVLFHDAIVTYYAHGIALSYYFGKVLGILTSAFQS